MFIIIIISSISSISSSSSSSSSSMMTRTGRTPSWLFAYGQMGSTLMGPQQSNEFRQIEIRIITPWHFCADKNRLTGVPPKSLSKNVKFAVTPLMLTPFLPFWTLRSVPSQDKAGACITNIQT